MTSRDDDLESLRESEERLRLALEAGEIGAWEWRPTTGETFWDARSRRLANQPLDARPSLEHFLAQIHEDDRARVRLAIEATLDPERRVAYDCMFRVASETGTRWIHARGRCSFDAQARPDRFVGTLVDVTDRESFREQSAARKQRAEAGGVLLRRLVESPSPQDSLRAVCEQTSIALDVPIVAVRAIDESTGLTSSAYMHGPPLRVMPGPEVPAAREAFLAEHGDVAQFPDISIVPNFPGRERFLEAGIRAVAHARMVAHGNTIGLLIVATDRERHFDEADVTFLKSAGDLASVALASARVSARYEQIVTTMSEGVVLGDLQRRILYANAAACAFFGESPTAIVGKHIDHYWFEEDAVERRAGIAEARGGGSATRKVRRYRTADGHEVWASVAFSRLDAPGSTAGFLAVLTDVTESRKLDAKMLQSQKLESLGVLAGGIAHDFNNLLVGILGNASLARDEMGADGPASESIRDIQNAAMRAADLTRQLLAYAGKGRFVITKVDLRGLVAEMGQLVSALIPKNTTLRYELGSGPAIIEGDATQLRQVIMNLISNAAEAMDERGGVIRIGTRVVELDRSALAAIQGETLEPGPYVLLEVTDTGVGMSAETRAKIFDPFFTTKFTGRGLGLAAVLGIMRAHRGGITVESELGRGTTLRAVLPVGGLTPLSTERPQMPVPHAGSGVVLVADDEPAVLRVIQRTLQRDGYEVHVAADGNEAVELFRAHAAKIDLVLLDVSMPTLDGVEAVLALREIAPHVPIVLTSGYSEAEAKQRLKEVGVAGFLAKPFTSATLLDRVREVLRASRGQSV